MPVTSHSTVALRNSIVSCSGQSHLQPLQDTLLLNSFVLQECRRDFIVPDHGAGLTNNFRRQCRSAVFRLQVTHCYSWFSGMCSRTASMGISSAATFRRWSHHCLEVNMGSGNGLMSPGTGSLPGPMSTSFQTPYCVIDLKEVSAIAYMSTDLPEYWPVGRGMFLMILFSTYRALTLYQARINDVNNYGSASINYLNRLINLP